jgi:flagellar export protein FliJ
VSKAFTFRLDAALRQRVHAEQTAQLAYARAVQEGRAALAALNALRGLVGESRREGIGPGMAIDPEGRMSLLLFVDQASQRARRQEQVVAERKAATDRAQEILLQAAARRRALERLRERRLEEFMTEERLRTDHELDEQTTLRYARSWT